MPYYQRGNLTLYHGDVLEHGSKKMDVAVDRDVKRDSLKVMERKTTGWQTTCKCGQYPVPATVLDPFSGAATTGVVALKLGRKYIGIDLNEKYLKDIAIPRLEAEFGLFDVDSQ